MVPTYYPAVRYGGPVTSIRLTCATLAQQGHDVRVFTTNVDGPSVLDVPAGRPCSLDGVAVTYFPARIAGSVYYSPDLGRGLQTVMGDVDIVHIHSVFTWTTPAAAWSAARAGVPFVLSPRGALVPEYIRNKSRIPKTIWLQSFGRPIFARAARLHATTEAEYRDAQRVGLRLPDALVVPNGVAAPEPHALAPLTSAVAAARGDQPYLLFVGRLDPVKRLELVLEALAHTTMRLVVAGDGDRAYRRTLQTVAERLGVSNRVAWLGQTQGDDTFQLMRDARALVLASVRENFGNVVVEAMAMGCPVVVTPGVGAAGIVRQAGAGMVSADGPEALRSALMELWGDTGQARRLGQAGQRHARLHLSPEATTERLVEGYRQALDEYRPPR